MSATVSEDRALVAIRLPVWWTFGGLLAGLVAGSLLAGSGIEETVLSATAPIGTLWLRALQMCIIPLVAALLVLGIAQLMEAARAGATARRMLGWMLAMLGISALLGVTLVPLLLDAFPVQAGASSFIIDAQAEEQALPGVSDFLSSLIAANLVAAAADTAMLPLTIFFALFAVAAARLPAAQRDVLLNFFHALGNAMLTIIGWVLWLAPVGVFALGLGVAVRAGGDGVFATLVHYILVVSSVGVAMLIVAYAVASLAGRLGPARFARGVLPAQAVAVSTQSSLASLPAMLDSANRLGLRSRTAEFVLPLAVAIFRVTSPGMNLAVAVYVGTLAGIDFTWPVLLAGLAIALIISVGTVSLPGSISFVVSIGPIAAAMGVPIEPLVLLVAVEMLPDIVRTLANVTMNVAVTAAVDRDG